MRSQVRNCSTCTFFGIPPCSQNLSAPDRTSQLALSLSSKLFSLHYCSTISIPFGGLHYYGSLKSAYACPQLDTRMLDKCTSGWVIESYVLCFRAKVQILLCSLKKLHWICCEVQQISKVFVDRDIVEGGYCWLTLNLSSSYFSLHMSIGFA